jgi:hypothetical protein
MATTPQPPAPVAAPTVTGVSPDTGPGGTKVTVTGTGFTDATRVNFGHAPAPYMAVSSDSQLTATAPPAVGGRVDVTVTTPAGTSPATSAGHFTYWVLPR